jgi:hypothetical protein
MDVTQLKTLQTAKRQFTFIRAGTLFAVALWLGSLLASMLLKGPYHQLAVSASDGAILGAFFLNADIGLFSGVITRADLIRIIEAHANRDPKALAHRAGGKADLAEGQ